MNKENKHRLQEIIDYHNERLNEKTIHIKPGKIPTELHGLKTLVISFKFCVTIIEFRPF